MKLKPSKPTKFLPCIYYFDHLQSCLEKPINMACFDFKAAFEQINTYPRFPVYADDMSRGEKRIVKARTAWYRTVLIHQTPVAVYLYAI